MGTSQALPELRGAVWAPARRAGKHWLGELANAPEASPEPFVAASRQALAETLRGAPAAYSLKPTLTAAANRLVDTLEAISSGGTSAIRAQGELAGIDDPANAVLVGFVNAVAGQSGGIVDSAVRRAAATAAERLLADPDVACALRSGRDASRISGELFCMIYQLFLGEVVGEFLTTVVVTKLQLAVPVLPLLPLGVGDVVSDWVAEQVLRILPDPCEVRAEPGRQGSPLPEIARDLLGGAVRAALGLDEEAVAESARRIIQEAQ